MAQSQLRKDLIQLRFKAHLPEKSFIPQKGLYRLLNRERILAVVRAVQEVPGYRVDDVVDIIAKGGAKVLAILSLLKGEEGQILKFISHDQFQRSSLDSKLPLSVAALSDIVPDIAAEFYSAQWEVAAPVFSTGVVHRELHDLTRLPFVRDESLGDGGFGDIYEIELHPDHQVIDFVPKEDHLRAVRKEFKRSDEAYGYELELRNLNILNELSHPNIVELLGSYTYRGKHNLLFRLAPGGNLATLFENDRPQAFASDQSIYRALSQLSSAIETVHNFTSKSLDLACIGCHHDLKPRNILVQENKFILADFGISRIKDASESSKEEFQIGAGHYLAPECEDFENNFQKHTIGRSSDIWSFGCIIAEVLTYMIKGKGAVEEFRRARALKFGSFKTYAFHAGSSDSHSGVLKWLSGLEDEGTTADRLCVELVRDMLAIDPNNRPNAKQVTSKLRYISLTAQMQATDKIFREMSLKIDSVEADLETRRYNAWKDTLGNITIQERPWYTAADALLDFDDFFECLIKIDEEIRRILFRFQTAFRPLFNGLRDCVNTLISHLPLDSREQIQTRVEVGLIESEDLNELNSVQERYEQAAVGDRIGMLATIKLMSILALERTKTTRPDLHLDFKTITISTSGDRPLIDHDIGTIDSDQRNVKGKIVIEWRRYATYWHGPVSSEMLARIEANAELLSPSNKPPNVRSLDCIGFFHQPLRHAFGIVYRFPGQQNATFELSPLTLASIVRKTADTRARPSLDDRFNLAHQLVSSVLEFHKVGWMHKAICPHNIAFFPGKRAHPLDWIKEPYIIGFNHSRQNEPKAFTEGPSVYNLAAKYQHYEYHGERAYLQAFDYYSLGLVLLEIGLWKLLEDQTAGWRYADGKEMRKMLFEKRVALLAHHMGTQYCSAVKACLSVELVTETGNMSQLEFATQVVQPLRLCSLYGRTAS